MSLDRRVSSESVDVSRAPLNAEWTGKQAIKASVLSSREWIINGVGLSIASDVFGCD